MEEVDDGVTNCGSALPTSDKKLSPLARQSEAGVSAGGSNANQPGALATINCATIGFPVPWDVAGVRAADRKYPIKRCRPGRQVGIGVDIRIG